MPVNYDIPNVNDFAAPCIYCGGSGAQNVPGVGWRQCQYCVQGYKVALCPQCQGHGCEFCMGTLHNFHSDLIQQTSIQLPNTTQRHFADGASPRPPLTINRRNR